MAVRNTRDRVLGQGNGIWERHRNLNQLDGVHESNMGKRKSRGVQETAQPRWPVGGDPAQELEDQQAAKCGAGGRKGDSGCSTLF